MTTSHSITADELTNVDDPDRWELIKGALHEVSPSGQKASAIAVEISFRLKLYLQESPIGVVTGADGGFMLETNPDTVIAPDVGFVGKDRMLAELTPGFFPGPPDFAVEVISPSDKPGDILQKQALYSQAGVALVWWVDPELQQVSVFRRGKPAEVFGLGDTLSGGDVLPGFELSIVEMFRG